MTPQEVKNELYEIGKRYPSLLGLMKKTVGESTVGSVWAGELRDIDAAHFQDVCHEYASFRRELPDHNERLPYEIRQEVFKRTERDAKALEQHTARLEYERCRQVRESRRRDVVPISELLDGEKTA